MLLWVRPLTSKFRLLIRQHITGRPSRSQKVSYKFHERRCAAYKYGFLLPNIHRFFATQLLYLISSLPPFTFQISIFETIEQLHGWHDQCMFVIGDQKRDQSTRRPILTFRTPLSIRLNITAPCSHLLYRVTSPNRTRRSSPCTVK